MTHVPCALCGAADGVAVGVGQDFEYRTSDQTFFGRPLPVVPSRLSRPSTSVVGAGTHLPGQLPRLRLRRGRVRLVHRVRSRLEASRTFGSLRPPVDALDRA